MNALVTIFPDSKNFLCIWHIEINILVKCKRYFDNNDDFDKFLNAWKAVLYSKTLETYESELNNLSNLL
jgi:hypothetical protein